MTDFDCSNRPPPPPTLELYVVSEMCLLIHLSSIACTHLHFEARFKKQKEKKKAKSETMLAGVKVQKSSKGRADNMSCKIFYMTTGNRRNGDKDLTSVHFLKQRKDFFFFFRQKSTDAEMLPVFPLCQSFHDRPFRIRLLDQ